MLVGCSKVRILLYIPKRASHVRTTAGFFWENRNSLGIYRWEGTKILSVFLFELSEETRWVRLGWKSFVRAWQFSQSQPNHRAAADVWSWGNSGGRGSQTEEDGQKDCSPQASRHLTIHPWSGSVHLVSIVWMYLTLCAVRGNHVYTLPLICAVLLPTVHAVRFVGTMYIPFRIYVQCYYQRYTPTYIHVSAVSNLFQ
jgi:hypothetical protein